MIEITCSICKRTEDMRDLQGTWAEDGTSDICPECFPEFKERTDILVEEYNIRKNDIVQEISKDKQTNIDTPSDNVVSIFGESKDES